MSASRPATTTTGLTVVPAVDAWPTPCGSAVVKSTAARLGDPGDGVVNRAGVATRIAAVWAVAAALVMAGLLAGPMLRRRF